MSEPNKHAFLSPAPAAAAADADAAARRSRREWRLQPKGARSPEERDDFVKDDLNADPPFFYFFYFFSPL